MSDTKPNQLAKLKSLLVALETCNDENYRTIRDEIYGIAQPENYELLRKELYHHHYRRRMAAATNLGRLGDEKAVYGLVELLRDPQVEVREMAVFSLGLLGDPETISPILELVNDYNADVRYRVLIALEELDYPMLEVVLIRAMNDDSQGVREQALIQLKKIGTVKSGAVVLRALLERDYDMQILAEEALDRIVPKFTDATYALINEGLSLRERRLIINYFENRNLQFVYPKLYEVLHIGHAPKPVAKLAKFGRLLNDDSERPFLQYAFERDDIVEELFQHFANDNRRSILLVGDAGSGKTAITNEVTRRLIESGENSNDPSEKWTVLETSTTELITETRFLGEWETKLKKMMEAIEEVDGYVLIFLTNPNDLLGAGAHSNSDENFADFFRPYLQRGQIRIIAETTEEELRKGLTQDPGFLRLFKQVRIPPLSSRETSSVITKKLEHDDIETLRNEKAKLQAIHRNLDLIGMKFRASKEVVDAIVYFSSSFMTRSSAPGNACDLLDQIASMRRTEMELQTTEKNTELDETTVIDLQIEDVTRCLSKSSGIPLNIIDPTAPINLKETHYWFSKRLIGQKEPIDEIVNRLAIIKAGLNDPTRPLGVYFLVGPTGVGKTYFSKLLAQHLFGDEKRLLRFDLSEYQGVYAVEKLIGSPHAKQREGLLTEAVRNQPFSVILLDEFEKANKDIFSLFLQVFDDARLTDANGKTTDFTQTVILITSNLGASKTSVNGLGFGSDTVEGLRDRIHDKMKEFFPPEFINRLDRVITFDPLEADDINHLVDIEVHKLIKRRGLSTDNLNLKLTTSARQWLADNGFSKTFGARHLLRTVEQHVIPSIARLLIGADIEHNKTILIRKRRNSDPDYGTKLFAIWDGEPLDEDSSTHENKSRETIPDPDTTAAVESDKMRSRKKVAANTKPKRKIDQ